MCAFQDLQGGPHCPNNMSNKHLLFCHLHMHENSYWDTIGSLMDPMGLNYLVLSVKVERGRHLIIASFRLRRELPPCSFLLCRCMFHLFTHAPIYFYMYSHARSVWERKELSDREWLCMHHQDIKKCPITIISKEGTAIRAASMLGQLSFDLPPLHPNFFFFYLCFNFLHYFCLWR